MKRKFLSMAAVTLAMTMCIGNTAFAAQSKYFVDVNDSNYGWSVDYVDYLCEKGIASGTGENKYSPELPIERGDFIVLIDKAFDLVPVLGLSVSFSDVNEDMYYYQPIVDAKGNGIIKDMGAFYPEMPITRSDAMTILYRAMNLNNYIKTTGSTDLSMYADGDIIKDVEVKNAIGTLTKIGIISGSNGYLKPMDTMTRAEMAVVFSKTLQYIESNSATEIKPVEDENLSDTDEEQNTTNAVISGEKLTQTILLDGDPYTSAKDITMEFRGIADEGAAIVVKNKVSADINNATLSVNTDATNAINISKYSSLELSDSNIKAVGNQGSAVSVDSTSTVSIENTQLQGVQNKGYALKSEGMAEINNSVINNKMGSAISLIDDSTTKVDGSTINADGSDSVFLINTTSPLGKNNKSELTLSNSTISADGATLLKVDTNDFKATIENCTIGKLKNLLDTTYNYQVANTYSNDVEITLINQKVEANVYSDDISNVVINLTKDSYLKGKINETNYADYIEINIENGSTLELTDDAYISVITVEDFSFIDIKDNSFNIYYDKSLSANDWLDGATYSLPYGGELRPY